MEVDWGRVVDLLLGGVVQAVVILSGAWFAIRLERRARYRREVEEAILCLLHAHSTVWTDLMIYSESNGAPARARLSRDIDCLTESQRLLSQVHAKADGYGRTKRDLIARESRRLALALLYATDAASLGNELPAQAVEETSLQPLYRLVFERREGMDVDEMLHVGRQMGLK